MSNSEKYIESHLVEAMKALDGYALKWVSPGTKGIPDRIVITCGGSVFFVETKSEGDTPGPLQLYWHKKLLEVGIKVYVIDTMDKLEDFLGNVITQS